MSATLVLAFHGTGRFSFTALAGALEREEARGGLTVRFARDREAMAAFAAQALEAGEAVGLGFSFYSPGFPEAAAELAWVRERLGPAGAQVRVVAGGVHATAEPEETLRAGFDLVAVGEGERTLCELAARLRAGESWAGVPGTARLAEGRLQSHGRAEGLALDDYPPFSLRHGKYGSIEITRGCVYACRFCQTPFFNKARFRHRAAPEVARYARALRQSGRRDLRFISPTALSYGSPNEGVDLAAVEDLLARCREAMGDGRVFFGTFPSEVRPEHVTPEALALLKRYVDNDNLIIGGQSGSDRILESSHRGHDVEAIERAVRLSAEAGLVPNVDFILGLPGEEEADVQATLALMERLAGSGARVHGHTFMPLPGTPFRRAPPGAISPAARERLDRLASQGRLYGQWRRQAELAQQIAERRDARAQAVRPPSSGRG